MNDSLVRRDVDRAPGGSYRTYQNRCVGCHAGMDALGGAFSQFDFQNNSIIYYTPPIVAPKMNQNGEVFPTGRITVDHSWINLWTERHNASLGWRGELSGFGVQSFGTMLANSEAFSQCMAKKVFSHVCKRELSSMETEVTTELATGFEENGYQLKRLFQDVAVHPSCMERPE